MFFGLPETANSSNNNSTADKEAVTKILKYLQPNADFNSVTPFRLGKYDPSRPKPRPIKVKLSSEELLYSCLKNGKKLKSHTDFSQIIISNDRTPLQQEEYRSRRAELQQRINNGETDIKIKYIKGIPKIVSSLN